MLRMVFIITEIISGTNLTLLFFVDNSLPSAANLTTFIIMIFGILLQIFFGKAYLIKLILAFGLFGFAGCITNWLAVKMLFYHIPCLWGSGVIQGDSKRSKKQSKFKF
jgi:hypothetical protein